MQVIPRVSLKHREVDMQVEPLPQVHVRQNDLTQGHAREPRQDFNDVLLAEVSRPPLLHPRLSPETTTSCPAAGDANIPLGTLNETTPTIFALLRQNGAYADRWWKIVHSSVNKDIDYRHLPLGTEVLLDAHSDALILVSPQDQERLQTESTPASPKQPSSHPKISLGTIDGTAPTVSHLLKKNDLTRTNTWDILQQPINKKKDFSDLRPGTEIFLDESTEELLWASPGEPTSAPARASNAEPAQQEISLKGESQPVSLGKISDEAPTVSHLLVGNSNLQGKAWKILFSEVNRDKQFTELRNGTEIFLKPETGELLWGKALAAGSREIPATAPSPNTHPLADVGLPSAATKEDMPEFSSRLANAVKPYFGRSYDEINCYGLVVRGLRRMGIKYSGSGGIRDRLVRLATEKGLPANSFFNGEGLIEATGKKIFSRTFQRVGNAEREADRLFRDITGKLQKGDILSFSTESNGHTGIISSQGNQWTFINSGDLDNTVSSHHHPAKGVGEENLRAEIKNWLEKAHAERQSLLVTLGRLQEEKLRAAMQHQRPILSSTL